MIDRIHSKVDEYAELDKQKKQIESRMAELKPVIKKALMSELEPGEDGHIRYSQGNVTLTLQVKRSKTNFNADEGALQQLLIDKDLWEDTKMEVANRDIVKQLWIEGQLTDDDLRSILPTPKDPTTALQVDFDV